MQNNRKQVEAAIKQATIDGLNDAAQIYYNNMKKALRGGFTSGDFVTGNLINSVTRTPVESDGTNARVRVGTNILYALFWEVGHHNIYTRRREREERWRPTLMSSLREMQRAIRNAFKRKNT